jgi:glycosyltransferase involved in cell wall biosynthesis
MVEPPQGTVSIVIPTFNRAKLVRRAIDTALAQTHACEVLVCDHGSSDDTPAVAASYGQRIRYVRKEQDRGPIACWRDGIEHATGEFVHINYDDDWIDARYVEATLPLLRDDVAFVYTRVLIHETGDTPGHLKLRHPAGIRPVAGIVEHLLREQLTISPGCALFRRRDLLKNLLAEVPGARGQYGKNSGVGEDLLLFLLATLDYPRYAHLPEALSHFLAHPTSITTNAGQSGRMTALVDAYALAKQHYLAQPGAIAARTGLARWFARRRWKLAGGGSRRQSVR